MPLRTIVCLDDLIRPDAWPASELVFDLVRIPIFHTTGLNIGKTPHRPVGSQLLPGFSLDELRRLCTVAGEQPAWHQLHQQLPQPAAQYLMAHLPADALVLGHAMPPWLSTLLDVADIPYIDLRVSPLRFGSDLVVGLRTNRPALHASAQALALSPDDLLAEAHLLGARLRMRRHSEGRLRLLNNPCIFVGQTEGDASLLGADGRLARASDHADTLRRLAATGPMMYLPHPQAGDFARIERESIERVTGQRVSVCELDAYELLACEDELMLLGLNAHTLQEAAWFARTAYALSPLPAVPSFDARPSPQGYLQMAPATLMGERLWASLFDTPLRVNAQQPQPRPNLLRELLNDWSGYASATLRGDEAQRVGHALAGGQRQAEALRRCEQELAQTRGQLHDMGAELLRLKALVERMNRPAPSTLPDNTALPASRARRTAATGSRKTASAL